MIPTSLKAPRSSPAVADVDAAHAAWRQAVEGAGLALVLDVEKGQPASDYAIQCARDAIAARATYSDTFERWWHQTLDDEQRRNIEESAVLPHAQRCTYRSGEALAEQTIAGLRAKHLGGGQ